jgi:hypothetical protein
VAQGPGAKYGSPKPASLAARNCSGGYSSSPLPRQARPSLRRRGVGRGSVCASLGAVPQTGGQGRRRRAAVPPRGSGTEQTRRCLAVASVAGERGGWTPTHPRKVRKPSLVLDVEVRRLVEIASTLSSCLTGKSCRRRGGGRTDNPSMYPLSAHSCQCYYFRHAWRPGGGRCDSSAWR